MMVYEAVVALVAHWHGVALLPTELRGVELERSARIAGRQLVPATVADLVGRKDVALLVFAARRRNGLHDVKGRALRVGDHGDAADIRNVERGHIGLSAALLD